ncbi:MAG: ParB N-terminal domain-containing protein [Anaplasmataceae bacterium]|nr:ParB N-terminal domain-containing protein [Anaplasmataceae bacterium]
MPKGAQQLYPPPVGRVIEIEIDDIRPMPKQPRIFFPEDEDAAMGASLDISQENPVKVIYLEEARGKPHFELDDGERRLRGSRRSQKVRKLQALVVERRSEIDRFESAFRSNLGKSLTPYEKMLACWRLANEKSYTTRELAVRLDMDPGIVNIYLLIMRDLHPSLVEHLRPDRPPKDRLRVMSAYNLSRYNHTEQLAHYREMLGMSDRQAEAYLRRRVKTSVVRTGGRGRRPSDDYYSLASAVDRAAKGVKNYVEMGRMVFRTMFANRDPKDVKATLADIDEAIAILGRLRKLVEGSQE